MTIYRFIPPLCPDANTYAFLIRRHRSEAGPTGGWSIPNVCKAALKSPSGSKRYPASESERTLLDKSGDPCDDITSHWAQLMCTDAYLRRCVDPGHLEKTIQTTWKSYESEWNFLVNSWCK